MQTIVRQIALAGSIVLTGLSSAFAAVVDFPNADSSGDLSSAAAWGDTLPAATDTIQLNRSYGQTLTFGQSCTFDSILFTGDRTANTIEIVSPDVKVTLLGATTAGPGIRSTGASAASLTLKGGTYDLSGTGILRPGPTSDSKGNSQIVLDGAVVTNAAEIAAEYDGNNGKLLLTNGSRVYAARADHIMSCSGFWRKGTVEVSGGSRLALSGSFAPFNTYTDGGTFLVTGEGSLVTNSASSTFFKDHVKNSTLRIADGGELTLPIPNFYCGEGGNRVIVDGGAFRMSGASSSTLYLPYSGSGLSLQVLAGGTFSAPCAVTFGQSSSENSIVISNAMFSAGNFLFKGSKNSLRILGKNSQAPISFSNGFFGGGAYQSLLEYGDGITTSVGSPYFGVSGCYGNTLSVVDGATVAFGELHLYSAHANTLYDYTVRVANGATVTAASGFVVTGHDNRTIVSNATLNVTGTFKIGEAYQYVAAEDPVMDSGCSLVFQGTNPCVRVSGASTIMRGGVIRFEVSPEGYADGSVLWSTYQLSNGKGDVMKLELSGVDENFVRNLDHKFDVILIKQTGVLSVDLQSALSGQVAAISETLPKGVRLYFVPDKSYPQYSYQLHLSAKPQKGMMLLVR